MTPFIPAASPINNSSSLKDLYSQLAPIAVPRNKARFTNWGRSYTCLPSALFEPETERQCELVLELGRRERRAVRAVGVGHSPSDLACTKDFMIRMTKLNSVLEVNTEKCYVVAQGGITLGDLHSHLARHNLAMTSVGSISEQTLGGVIATATHGSGRHFGVISTSVISLTLLLADGTRRTCSRNEHADLFLASLCGLGATGLILSVTLAVEPSFRLKEVQKSLKFEEVITRLDDHVSNAQHVRLWWYPTKDVIRVSYCNRTNEPTNPAGKWVWHTVFGHHVIQFLLFIARYHRPLNNKVANFACWLTREDSEGVDDSLKIFNVDCRYPQYTTEWAIPYENTRACLTELREFLRKEFDNPKGLRPHFPIEIRFSAADDIWLSPAFGRLTCWIGIVQYKPYAFPVPYRTLFSAFESIAIRHGGRPHWAKAHPFTPTELREVYPKFDDFARVMENVDPLGVWRNEYIERHLIGKEVGWRVFKKRS